MKSKRSLALDLLSIRALLSGKKVQHRFPVESGSMLNPNQLVEEGETIYVKEMWRLPRSYRWDKARVLEKQLRNGEIDFPPVYYEADGTRMNWRNGDEIGKTRNPIYMPWWLTRIRLYITDVWEENLWDMLESDKDREGMAALPEIAPAARGWKFADFWNSIHARRGYPYSCNPLVYCTEFDVKILESHDGIDLTYAEPWK